jgi:hypothetical protein
MPEQFKILSDFLRQFEPEVQGREGDPPDEQAREKIRSFALGKLAPPEREEFLALIEKHPSWTPILAAEVKALRRQG